MQTEKKDGMDALVGRKLLFSILEADQVDALPLNSAGLIIGLTIFGITYKNPQPITKAYQFASRILQALTSKKKYSSFRANPAKV